MEINQIYFESVYTFQNILNIRILQSFLSDYNPYLVLRVDLSIVDIFKNNSSAFDKRFANVFEVLGRGFNIGHSFGFRELPCLLTWHSAPEINLTILCEIY